MTKEQREELLEEAIKLLDEACDLLDELGKRHAARQYDEAMKDLILGS